MAAEYQCWTPTSSSDLDSGCEEAESLEPGEDSGCPAIHHGGACLWLWGKAIWMSYDRWMFVFDCRFIYCSFLVIVARPLCLTRAWTQCSRKLHRGLVSSSASFYPQVHKYTSLGSREQPLPCVVAVATHSFLMFPVGWDKPAAFAELATGCCGESLSWELHPLSPFAHSPKHRWASEGLAGSSHTNRCLRVAQVQTSNSWSWCIDVHDDEARVVKLLVGQLSVKDPSKSQSLTMPIPQECVTLGSYRIRCNLVGCCWRQSKLYVFPLIGHLKVGDKNVSEQTHYVREK